VPLILSAPGLARPGVVTEPVGLIDVVPTVLDLVGIPAPAGLDGMSLAGRVRGGSTPGGQPGRVFYMETAPGNAQAARDDRFKVMRFEDGRELAFDLAADPEEKRPLGSAMDPDVVARLDRLRAELVRRHDECQRRRERSAAERTGETELDPTRREKLRALGYAE